jgi:hypothetical protein
MTRKTFQAIWLKRYDRIIVAESIEEARKVVDPWLTNNGQFNGDKMLSITEIDLPTEKIIKDMVDTATGG